MRSAYSSFAFSPEMRDIPVLSANQIGNGAASHEQVQVLEEAGFLQRMPLWNYILAEAAVLQEGQCWGRSAARS